MHPIGDPLALLVPVVLGEAIGLRANAQRDHVAAGRRQRIGSSALGTQSSTCGACGRDPAAGALLVAVHPASGRVSWIRPRW